jgi:ParB family chromosome partitioning protein
MENFMQVIDIDPKKCIRWKFADRSGFEFGDIFALSQDILKNGQIEPVILRKPDATKDQYEVIAGSRRWKACLEANIPLKGIVKNLSDEQAAIAQIKENQQLSICDYSKGIYYSKLITSKKMSVTQLADSIGCSKAKLENFLAFDKVPTLIWDAVGNLSRISSRTASTIYALSQKGEQYIQALIDLAEEIRKGAGCRTIEQKVLTIIKGSSSEIDYKEKIILPSGRPIASWTKTGLQFAKDLPLNQQEIAKALISYFQKSLKDFQQAS